MALGIVPGRWWTPRELERRKLLPYDRVMRAVRRGELPAVVLEEDVLIGLRDLDMWLGEERGRGTWVDDWLRYRQTEEGRSLRPPPAPFGTTTTNTKEGVQ
jgi:hypothetical protein